VTRTFGALSHITQRITPTRQTCDGPLETGQIKSHPRFLHLVYRSSDGVQMITVQGNVKLKRSRTEASSPNPPSKKATGASALKHLEVSTTMALPSPKLHTSASLDTMPRSIAAGLAAYTHTHPSLHSRTSTNYEASNHTMAPDGAGVETSGPSRAVYSQVGDDAVLPNLDNPYSAPLNSSSLEHANGASANTFPVLDSIGSHHLGGLGRSPYHHSQPAFGLCEDPCGDPQHPEALFQPAERADQNIMGDGFGGMFNGLDLYSQQLFLSSSTQEVDFPNEPTGMNSFDDPLVFGRREFELDLMLHRSTPPLHRSNHPVMC